MKALSRYNQCLISSCSMMTPNFKYAVITGSAGFIGFHVQIFLEKGITILGIDNFNDYYDVNLKRERCQLLKENQLFELLEANIADLNFCDEGIKSFL